MARRLIGLDVGTNAVTIAEVTAGDPPRLSAFGQVALARDAMREGEVVDDAALVDAIRRLRAEVGIRRGAVRVGIAGPRVIVRTVELPVMPRDDLLSALRFQIPDLVPIPLDDAVVDFAVLDETRAVTGEHAGSPMQRVLLAAAPKALVLRVVEAVESAGFAVDGVDLAPLALVRSVATRRTIGSGAEAIVSIGGGVTCVVVHEAGMPRFVRMLGTGGRGLTDAVATALEVSADAAEGVKRRIGHDDTPEAVEAARAIERPLAALLEDIRGSLDFYRNQPGATPLSGVVLTGGGSQLSDVRERLAAVLGVAVERAEPRAGLSVGDIGFPVDELPRLDPYLAVAAGLATGLDGGVAVDLVPGDTEAAARRGRARTIVAGVLAAAVVAVALAIPVLSRNREASSLRSQAGAVERDNLATKADIATLSRQSASRDEYVALQALVDGALHNDVAWSRMLNEIARSMPDDVWLTAFRGSVSGDGPAGSVTVAANGLDYTAIADWLARIAAMASLSDLWVPQAATADYGSRKIVSFSSTAHLTPKARSERSTSTTTEVTK